MSEDEEVPVIFDAIGEGGSKLTWYCHSKSPLSWADGTPLRSLFSLYLLFCIIYNKCGYTTGSFWKFWKRLGFFYCYCCSCYYYYCYYYYYYYYYYLS